MRKRNPNPVLDYLSGWKREAQKDALRGAPYDPAKYAELESLLDEIEEIAEGPGVCERNGNVISVKFAKRSGTNSNGNTIA